jgi:hypothetical protein
VRIKPLTAQEKEIPRNNEWKEMHGDTITLSGDKFADSFTFDNVFGPDK